MNKLNVTRSAIWIATMPVRFLSLSKNSTTSRRMSQSSLTSVRSNQSARSPQSRLRPSGGYRDLRSFNTTTVVYDATVSFCHRFLDPRSRLVDK